MVCCAFMYFNCWVLACFCHSSRVLSIFGNIIICQWRFGFSLFWNIMIIPRSMMENPTVFIRWLNVIMYMFTSPPVILSCLSWLWAISFSPESIYASLKAFLRFFQCLSLVVACLLVRSAVSFSLC